MPQKVDFRSNPMTTDQNTGQMALGKNIFLVIQNAWKGVGQCVDAHTNAERHRQLELARPSGLERPALVQLPAFPASSVYVVGGKEGKRGKLPVGGNGGERVWGARKSGGWLWCQIG